MKTILKVTVQSINEKQTDILYETELTVKGITIEQLINVSKGFSSTFQRFVNQELPKLLCH